jgi:predicted membrane protein
MVDGNLTIDQIKGIEEELVNSTLQYLKYQSSPAQSVNVINGRATLTLMASGKGQPWFHFPWAADNGATEWQVHLNPKVQSDITAHTGGGNIKLNFAGMAITHVAADSGGGNLDIVLPDNAVNLSVTAKTGAGDVTVVVGSDITGSNTLNASSGSGNVFIRVPGGIAARIHATSEMGKATMDSRFSKIDDTTYQTSNYNGATDKIKITINSGAGNVSVNTK